jgi:hypothetical protein
MLSVELGSLKKVTMLLGKLWIKKKREGTKALLSVLCIRVYTLYGLT